MFVVLSLNYFTIKLHYTGRFRCNIGLVPKITNYMSGKVGGVDNCDKLCSVFD